MDYVCYIPESLPSIDKNVSNLSSVSDKLDKKITEINNNVSTFLSDFKEYSNLVKSNLLTIVSSIQNSELYLSQIRDCFRQLRDLYYPDTQIAGNSTFKYDIKVGWYNFWRTFRYKKFDELLLDVHKQIEDKVNPLSDNNKDDFNANIDKLKTDTVYGSALELKDGMQNFYTNISGATPTASLNVNLLPVKFFGASIPAKTIKIDFSWFAPYRDTTLSLWRFFLWVGYIFIVFKRFPDILSGAGLITDTSANGNMTEGIENSFYNITMDDDGNVLSATESHTYKEGNSTYRYNVRKDVSGSSSTDIIKR